ALLVLERDGMGRVVNPAACQLFGSSERQLLGQPIEASTSAISPTGRLGELIRGGSLRDHEVTLGTGEQVAILSVSSFLMHDERDELAAVVVIARNVTRHKKAEEQVSRQREIGRAHV